MQQAKQATVEFTLRWQSANGNHNKRLGLVFDYFRRNGQFTGLGAETARDWPRPPDDQYAGQYAFADPLYAVWGRAG